MIVIHSQWMQNSSTTRNSEVDVLSKKEVEENSEVTDVSNLTKIY